MKVTEKKLPEGTIELTALASTAEVGHALTMAQYAFAQQMGVPASPSEPIAQTVERALGIKDLDTLVQQQAMDYLVPFAIDKSNIMPAYPPQMAASEPIKRGAPFTFQVEVVPRPEYELTSYEPVTISVPPLEVRQADIDAQMTQIAESAAEFITDDPHPIEEKDSFLVKLEASQLGKRLEGLSTESRAYVMGMGLMPESFEKNLLGMKPGDTKSFSFAGPGADPNQPEDVIDCTVEILEMQKRVVPEIDDAWVKENIPNFDDVASLREGISQSLQAQLDMQLDDMKLQLAAGELADRFEGSIPDAAYEATRQTILGNMQGQMQQQGIPFEQFVEAQGGEQQFAMMLMLQVRETLVQGYALDAVFRHEKLRLTDEDYLETCRQINPQNPIAARRDMEENGRGFALRELAERMKANRWVLDHAIVEVKDIFNEGVPGSATEHSEAQSESASKEASGSSDSDSSDGSKGAEPKILLSSDAPSGEGSDAPKLILPH